MLTYRWERVRDLREVSPEMQDRFLRPTLAALAAGYTALLSVPMTRSDEFRFTLFLKDTCWAMLNETRYKFVYNTARPKSDWETMNGILGLELWYAVFDEEQRL